MLLTTASQEFRKDFKSNKLLWFYLIAFGIIWLSTLVGTTDINNWFIENTLTVIFLAYIIYSYPKFKFSDLTYTFIFIYLLLHVYGAKYTYAQNPFGFWLQEQLHTSRNHYDRMVHFSFGFMLAYPMRDLFLNYFKFPKWVSWILPVEITISFSGLYEIIEWAVADLFFPSQGDAYLGTQGDVWDPQKDMCLAFSGAVLIMIMVAVVKKVFRK